MVKEFTSAEVAKHTSDNDCWLIVDNRYVWFVHRGAVQAHRYL